jgi:outer membrane protein assembly factor BamD
MKFEGVSTWNWVIALTLLAAMWGCNEYNEVLKSPDLDYKYEKAVAFLDSGACYSALPVFEDLSRLTRGTQMAADVQYHYARTHACLKDNYLARYHFRSFVRTFPKDNRCEQATFEAAMCSYRLSPSPALDQTETRAAIEEFQLFMDSYPSSSLRDSAQTLVDKLRDKLEIKSFESARLYHKTGQYRSAVIALENAMKDFPDSPFREEMSFLIVDSYFQYAEQSTERRKLERYHDTIEAFLTFVARFPASEFRQEAERIRKRSMAEIDRLEGGDNIIDSADTTTP